VKTIKTIVFRPEIYPKKYMQTQVTKGENSEKKPVFFLTLCTKILEKTDGRKLATIVGTQNIKND
jgi:hypothetical protein